MNSVLITQVENGWKISKVDEEGDVEAEMVFQVQNFNDDEIVIQTYVDMLYAVDVWIEPKCSKAASHDIVDLRMKGK